MKAKLLKEQMGVPAGTEMEVLETDRAWTLRAPSGAEIVVPSCDVEMVPDTEPFSEPKPEVDPKDPGLLVNIFGSQPQPVESEGPIDPETDPAVRDEDGNVVMNEPEVERTLLDDERDVDAFPEAHSTTDDDLDEALPEPQGDCDGEACESCQ